jgi:diguanylate cyclase (GGDEF)-like protein
MEPTMAVLARRLPPSLSVPFLKARGIAQLRQSMADGSHRFTALMLTSVICAIVSLITAVIFLGGTLSTGWFVVVGLLQFAVIACTLGALYLMSGQIKALSRATESDPATGCLNRRGFARAFDIALANAAQQRNDVALLALDLDFFKQINDRYGHNVGDLVLSDVAATLAETVGNEGVVARLGGEEFTVLLPGADAESAGVMAERMLENVRTGCCASLAPGSFVTMSIGIAAEHVTSVRDGAALRARADEALYMAKREGRDRVLLWAPGVRSLATPAAAMAAIVTQPRRSTARP